jgi:flagellar biosynthesis protein FlhG
MPKIVPIASGKGGVGKTFLTANLAIALAEAGHPTIAVDMHLGGILFSGDTALSITSANGSYQKDFVGALRKITRRDIKKIYPGHGEPITENVKRMLYISLDNVRKSRIF